MHTTNIHLYPDQFNRKETLIAESGCLRASTFCFDSGVLALRLVSDISELVILPFQGQQIWSAIINGRDLTMKTFFDQPYPTRDLLSTFGGFMVHCGSTAIGSPGPQDHHPIHGELPNAPYETAQVVLGEDQSGTFIGLTGTYRHKRTFNFNYIAQPLVKLYSGSSIFDLSMTITNLRQTPMPFMYLAHINFKAVDNGEIVYSTPCDPEHVKVRASIPSHMAMKPGYSDFIERLKLHPEDHLILKPELHFDPEIVFYIQYLADEAGWTRAMQVHPDGNADIIKQRLDQLNHGVSWISRTPDQQALGLEPGTAEVDGYTLENEKGNVRLLETGQSFHCDIKIGTLTPAEVIKERETIQHILSLHKLRLDK
jgi:hypothetical protein